MLLSTLGMGFAAASGGIAKVHVQTTRADERGQNVEDAVTSEKAREVSPIQLDTRAPTKRSKSTFTKIKAGATNLVSRLSFRGRQREAMATE